MRGTPLATFTASRWDAKCGQGLLYVQDCVFRWQELVPKNGSGDRTGFAFSPPLVPLRLGEKT